MEDCLALLGWLSAQREVAYCQTMQTCLYFCLKTLTNGYAYNHYASVPIVHESAMILRQAMNVHVKCISVLCNIS